MFFEDVFSQICSLSQIFWKRLCSLLAQGWKHFSKFPNIPIPKFHSSKFNRCPFSPSQRLVSLTKVWHTNFALGYFKIFSQSVFAFSDEWSISGYFLYYSPRCLAHGMDLHRYWFKILLENFSQPKVFHKIIHLGFLPILAHMMRRTPAPIKENSMRKGYR